MFQNASRLFTYSLVFLLVVNLASCKIQRVSYFKDVPDSTSAQKILQTLTPPPAIVRIDDVLNINIQTLDPQANTVLNQGNLPLNSGAISSLGDRNASQSIIAGYLVDKDGNVHLPYIGDVMVKGLTSKQVKDLVTQKISVYFKDPVVNVRFANYKITVLGEVRNPTTFLVPNENPTIFDALGLAGDITVSGRKDNVMLIRTDATGAKQIVRLNLDSTTAISSPYFYLKPDDVLYVEPTEDKVAGESNYRVRDIAVIASAISLMIVIIARLTL
ncbi:polysaccharide biosynthesis/export family protein [Parafilimonas sp.]|uniref:polysaccharide biosynthesis/export family protein n=1 Tax=Parafilimonas sp. TaxID=1969739 RepID=UPI0039E53D2F